MYFVKLVSMNQSGDLLKLTVAAASVSAALYIAHRKAERLITVSNQNISLIIITSVYMFGMRLLSVLSNQS